MNKEMFLKALWTGRRAGRFTATTGVLPRVYPTCIFYPHSNLQDIFPMSTTRYLVDLLSTRRDLSTFVQQWSKVQALQGSATAQKCESDSSLETRVPFSPCSHQTGWQLPAEDPNANCG